MGEPSGSPSKPCVALYDGAWQAVECPSGHRRFRVDGRVASAVCKIVGVTTTTTTTTTTPRAWVQVGEDRRRCEAGNDGREVDRIEECQAEAIQKGHNFFSFSLVGGTGPFPALCATHAECENPELGTRLPWKIYQGDVLLVVATTTTTTTIPPLLRRRTAILGEPCEVGGMAMMACMAVTRAGGLRPTDYLEHIPILARDCSNWMMANASGYRSIIMVGPQWQQCLSGSYSAHPETRFTTVDFCQPPELQAENVVCGNFLDVLPNLEWGIKGYSASYETGIPYWAKIDLITSITVKELSRVRGLDL